tara:strand:- start:101 stop:433 length:333 start_codon:yes stop_codon:yes gene_type:complete
MMLCRRVDHVRDWVKGTPEGEFVSMAVASTGKHYGIKEGVIYSFPVHCKNGSYEIVEGLDIDDFSRYEDSGSPCVIRQMFVCFSSLILGKMRKIGVSRAAQSLTFVITGK